MFNDNHTSEEDDDDYNIDEDIGNSSNDELEPINRSRTKHKHKNHKRKHKSNSKNNNKNKHNKHHNDSNHNSKNRSRNRKRHKSRSNRNKSKSKSKKIPTLPKNRRVDLNNLNDINDISINLDIVSTDNNNNNEDSSNEVSGVIPNAPASNPQSRESNSASNNSKVKYYLNTVSMLQQGKQLQELQQKIRERQIALQTQARRKQQLQNSGVINPTNEQINEALSAQQQRLIQLTDEELKQQEEEFEHIFHLIDSIANNKVPKQYGFGKSAVNTVCC